MAMFMIDLGAILIEHMSWVSHGFGGFHITTLDGCRSLMLIMCNLESKMY